MSPPVSAWRYLALASRAATTTEEATTMSTYAAIDLHSTNSVLAILDADGQCLRRGRLPNDLARICEALAPYRDSLDSVVVESTYNWYWLVDGLQAAGYRVRLAHVTAIEQYSGLKHGDDDSDAEHLANLTRLGILPEGYIYPRDERALRDLLRLRLRMVQHAVRLLHSMQTMWCRSTGELLSAGAFRKLDAEQLARRFPEANLQFGACARLHAWQVLQEQAESIESWGCKVIPDRPGLRLLKSTPGIGDVLGLTILLETGPIERFARVGHYVSYCRMVDSVRLSNGKRKGQGNRRSGNRQLAWAYAEAAHYALQYAPVRAWYQRKRAKVHPMVAYKAVAHKIARGCYFVLRDRQPFDLTRAFG
jgi:transposase